MRFDITFQAGVCLVGSLFFTSTLAAQLPAPVLPQRENFKPVVPSISVPEIDADEDLQVGHVSLVLTQKFLNELVSSQTVDEGPVREFILGADVVGSQRTVAQSSLQMIPSTGYARFVVNLNGTTTNFTTNFTQRAAIRSVGTFRFQMDKQVAFDGSVVSTWTPSAFLTADQMNVGAATRLSPVPFIGPLATRTALNVANRRTPAAQQIAAGKLTQRVGPRFNAEVDAKISAINKFLYHKLKPMLEEHQLDQAHFSAFTTADQLVISGSSRGASLLSGSSVPMDAKSDLSIVLDESLANQLLSRLPLAGLRIPDRHLKALVAGEAKTLTSSENPELISVVFDEAKPLQIHFRNGAIEVECRIAIQPVLGEIRPLHRFVLSLNPSLQQNSVQLVPTLVDVHEIGGESGKTASGLTIESIQTALSNELTPRTYPRKMNLSGIGAPVLNQLGLQSASITKLNSSNGKLIIEFDLTRPQAPVSLR